MSAFERALPRLSLSLLVVLVGACSATSASPSSSGAPSLSPSEVATPLPSGPMRLQVGGLDAGDYTTTAFQPRLTFTLGEGWEAFFPDDSDEIALGYGGGELAITRVSQVVDPATNKRVEAPEDLMAWLAQHPAFDAGEPQPIEVAGLSGAMLDVLATVDQDMFAYPTGNMRVTAGNRVRYYVLPLDGADLTIVMQAPSDEAFDAFILAVQPVLDSLQIQLP